MKQKSDSLILFLTIPLALAAAWVSSCGAFLHGTYRAESLLYAS